MMFALVAHATLSRPSERAYSNANRTIFSLPFTEMSFRHSATPGVCMYSMPAYRSSTFSRTMTRSTPRPEYGVFTPGISRTGRTFAYVSNSLRSVTFALFSPNPTGVSSGPFNATRVRVIESIVSDGTPEGRPFLKTSAPASCVSHSIGAPTASRIRWAAITHSGPIPSPGISVTGMVVFGVAFWLTGQPPRCRPPCYPSLKVPPRSLR